MATTQPRLDDIIIKVSGKLGDTITDVTDETGSFSLQDKVDAINEARKKFYSDTLNALNSDDFVKMFPEWREFVIGMSLTSKPERVRLVLKMVKNGVIINPIPPEHYIDSLNNSYSKFINSATEMWFMEYARSITVLNQPAITTADAFIYTQPEFRIIRSVGQADIVDPEIWLPDIVALAVKLLESDTQRG
jgi:hypothetical protein